MENEEWRPVVGYEGLYEVSTLGRVQSVDRWVVHRLGETEYAHFYEGRTLAQGVARKGYRTVGLSRHGVKKLFRVHRIVLEAFVGRRPAQMECRHKNGDPSDNRLVNLCWDTSSENNFDRVRHGTHHEAAKTHCPQGHPYDEENTLMRRQSRTGGINRTCRTCANAASLARYHRKRNSG